MDEGTDFPTDVLVCIFQRLQPNPRRQLRLVCRHWRQVIDTRTVTSLHSSAKTLIVTLERAYVVDSLSTLRCGEELILGLGYTVRQQPKVVGTCNGIICLCDDYGSITLYNPVTRERLAVPKMPQHMSWHRNYGFTYDQGTGWYMVVNLRRDIDLVMVFTLGEASWRGVSLDGWWCDLEDGFVTIDTTMYWIVRLKGGVDNVISLDLDGGGTPLVLPLPLSRPEGTWCLTKMCGRLAITFSLVSHRLDKTEVWVMEHAASAKDKYVRWSHQYSVHLRHTPRNQPQWHDHQHLTSPHFAHGRNHVLTWKWSPTGGGCALYRHMVSNDARKGRHGRVVEINERNQGMLIANISTDYDTFQTFDYVETLEPLSVYKCR